MSRERKEAGTDDSGAGTEIIRGRLWTLSPPFPMENEKRER